MRKNKNIIITSIIIVVVVGIVIITPKVIDVIKNSTKNVIDYAAESFEEETSTQNESVQYFV